MNGFLRLFEITTTASMALPVVAPTILGKRKEDEEEVIKESCDNCSDMEDSEIKSKIKVIDKQLKDMLDDEDYWGNTKWRDLKKVKKHLQRELDKRNGLKVPDEDEDEKDDVEEILSREAKRLEA